MSAGRPPKYKTAKQMARKIEEYFENCDLREKPYTIPGLAYFLGFSCRQSISEYANKPAFTDTIKRARLKIEQMKNEKLLMGEGSTAGVIFDLKNNHDWKDKTEVDTNQQVRIVADSTDEKI